MVLLLLVGLSVLGFVGWRAWGADSWQTRLRTAALTPLLLGLLVAAIAPWWGEWLPLVVGATGTGLIWLTSEAVGWVEVSLRQQDQASAGEPVEPWHWDPWTVGGACLTTLAVCAVVAWDYSSAKLEQLESQHRHLLDVDNPTAEQVDRAWSDAAEWMMATTTTGTLLVVAILVVPPVVGYVQVLRRRASHEGYRREVAEAVHPSTVE